MNGAPRKDGFPFVAALIRAKCLRIRLVKGCFSGTKTRGCLMSTTGTLKIASMTPAHGVCSGHRIKGVRFLKLMSAQRMTPEPRKSGLARFGPSLRLAPTLAVLALSLGGCGAGNIIDKFTTKDD